MAIRKWKVGTKMDLRKQTALKPPYLLLFSPHIYFSTIYCPQKPTTLFLGLVASPHSYCPWLKWYVSVPDCPPLWDCHFAPASPPLRMHDKPFPPASLSCFQSNLPNLIKPKSIEEKDFFSTRLNTKYLYLKMNQRLNLVQKLKKLYLLKRKLGWKNISVKI